MLHAFGDLKAIVAAGEGGRIEWSVLFMRAKDVIGIWQAMHLFPVLPFLWNVCAGPLFTLSSWQGMQASLAFSSALNR
jgi:hypothetical protein